MASPRTLLEMAGAPNTPPPLDRAALVLIDCQMEYVNGALPLPGIAVALAEGARVLALARAEGMPVVHVIHHGRAGGKLFDPQGPYAAIAREVAPVCGESVITKTMPNAFAGTRLDEQLREFGRNELVFVGFMTHLCVSSSVRAAGELGFRPTVVARAVATRDLPDGRDGVITAADLQRSELAALADRFATVVADAAALKR